MIGNNALKNIEAQLSRFEDEENSLATDPQSDNSMAVSTAQEVAVVTSSAFTPVQSSIEAPLLKTLVLSFKLAVYKEFLKWDLNYSYSIAIQKNTTV